MIKSISFDEQEILQGILKLHCTGPIELDPAYGRGLFYKDDIEEPRLKFDILPQMEGVHQESAEDLPLEGECINTIMFDPPFLATTGKSLEVNNDSNKINKRFTVFPSEKALHMFYIAALRELYRVLKYKGILIFKCQDKVSSGTQYFSHNFIMNEAEKIGFYCKDLFILLAKQRLVADWQLKNQQHARKFHCYFLVFQKTNKKAKYLFYSS